MTLTTKDIFKKYIKKRHGHEIIKLREALKNWLLISIQIKNIEDKYQYAEDYHSKILKYKCMVAWNCNHKNIKLFKKVS